MPRADDLDVVDFGPASTPEPQARPVTPRNRWALAAIAGALCVGVVIGWTAHQSTSRPQTPAPVAVQSRQTTVAPAAPVGCPDGAKVSSIDTVAPDELAAALRAAFPSFVVIDGVRGFSGFTGVLCGGSVTGRDVSGVTVALTVAHGLGHGVSQVTRLEQDGDNVRTELVRVTPEGWTIDVLVTGPTGERAPTRAMSRLANDPRISNPS
jgi:hypothetical protein